MEVLHFAKYPFVKDAIEYIDEREVSLDDVITHELYLPARKRAKARVIDALEYGEIQFRSMSNDEECLEEILSYAIARILVSGVGDKFLIKRYALAEGVTLAERLEHEELEVVEDVAYQLGITTRFDEEQLAIHFSDYLRLASRMRSKEWKLINIEIENGMVSLNQIKFARLMQQALQDRIEQELPLNIPDSIKKSLSSDISDLKGRADIRRSQISAQDFGKVTVENFPPCMKHLIAMAQAGENLPHSGRFALTTFLHHIGLSVDDILALFASSPDFDVSKTKYQIEHITGEISGTEYVPPECSTMKSYGVCFEPDKLCENPKAKVVHPLIYYRIKNNPRKPQATINRASSKS
ncbi:hypothetical protein [Candidatus Methanomassiliicoccus intestinalis]|uniref:hypothetical protein n=1 Tax=Candidatus Methanomassiliicoccus intestinalis TaxID=1406512 RepID=UPI0037DD8222